MKYTLRQLEIFLATANCQNLTRAAEKLCMSQSAASGALKELENQFDISLFDRVGKRLQLNDLGLALQPRAEELLERARELEEALGRHLDAGPIKVGATLSIGNYLAIPLVAKYMEQFPASRITLTVDNTARITHRVAHFELDVGLIEGEINNPDLRVLPWRHDELVVFCARQDPHAAKAELSPQDLLDARWILREPGSGTRQTFDRAMHDLLPELRIMLELEHTEAIKRAVEAGMGIGCLSRITLADAFAAGRLHALSVPGRDFRRALYLIYHKDKYHTAGLKHWLELCGLEQDRP
ncbi:MAG: LysR family transcriptional regulator [Pseudomonadales bacterium]|nr:LysR family transcriptional regulator [Pseudomonadales bacterium]